MTAPITFALPGGLNRYQEMLQLNDWILKTGKPARISVYDTLQGLQWNGGRPMVGFEVLTADDLREAKRRAQLLNEAGISLSLTFNNTLSSVDVDDEDGNDLLTALHNELNSVTIASETLRQHIALNYPKYKRTASICFSYMRLDDYQPLFDRYDLVVAMPILAYQPEALQQVPLDRISFILNDTCWLFCPRKDHYDAISRGSIAGNSSVKEQVLNLSGAVCHVTHKLHGPKLRAGVDQDLVRHIDKIRRTHFQDTEQKTERLGHCVRDGAYNITPKVRQSLIEMGVKNFKMEGRDYKPEEFQAGVVDFLKRIVMEEL